MNFIECKDGSKFCPRDGHKIDSTGEAQPASPGPVGDLLSALKPFADAAKGMAWESTPDHLTFWPVNSVLSGSTPISAGDMRRAMEIYAKHCNEAESKKEGGK